MNAPKHPDESWDSWSARLAGDLGALAEGDWITLATCVEAPAAATESAAPTRATHLPRTWRRLLGRDSAAAPEPTGEVPEAFLQARLLEGLIALECIADTEFEGLSDLTDDQAHRLVELGWEQDGDQPDLSRTFDPDLAGEAAELVAASLRDVLGASSPTDVDLRRSPA